MTPFFEAIALAVVCFALLGTLIVVAAIGFRMWAIEASHDRGSRLATKAANAAAKGGDNPIVLNEPPAPGARPSGFSILDLFNEAVRGEPRILMVRRFRFVGDIPIEEKSGPNAPKSQNKSPIHIDVIKQILEGFQLVNRAEVRWFHVPETLTAYAPVYDDKGNIQGAVAVDLNPVALRARFFVLQLACAILLLAALLFSALTAIRVFRLHRQSERASRDLDTALRLEAITIESLGEALYSIDTVSEKISWRGTLKSSSLSGLGAFPDQVEIWEQWIHPEDRETFRNAIKREITEDECVSIEYRIVPPTGTNVTVWVLDRFTLINRGDGTPLRIGAIIDNSAQKRTDSILREFIEQVPIAQFVLDGDTILDANPAAVQIVAARSTERLQGSPIWRFWPDFQPDGSHSAEAWSRHVLRAIKQGPQHFEWYFKRDDGSPLAADVFVKESSLESRCVILMACYDLTNSKLTQAKLEESEQRFRDVTAAVGEFVWEVGVDGHYTYASQRIEAILGISPSAAIGRSPLEWVHPDDQEQIELQSRKIVAAAQPFQNFVHRVLRNDGEVRWVRVSGVPAIDALANIIGFRGITLDITEQRRYEEELVLQKEAAESADRAKSSFLAMMSHEIRTPLNGVIGFTELLMDSPLTESQQEALHTIRSSGDALLQLLNDILDFSKIESGKIDIELQPTHLRNLIEDVIALHRPAAALKDVEVSFTLEHSIPKWILTDGLRLQQILTNLITNAVKFTFQGSVSIHVRKRVNESPELESQELEFTIIDSGIGIAPDHVERLFKPFSQADSSTTRQFGGTGLGLVISRRLAVLLGGDLQLESSVPGATKFLLRLPLVDAPAQHEHEFKTRRIWHFAPAPEVLVVDDNAVNRKLTEKLLHQLGAVATTVASGSACLEILATRSFDVILMDVQMPEMDGLEATRRIRTREVANHQARTPIVALTAGAMRGDREKCLEAGMDNYLTKPIRKDAIGALLAQILPGHVKESVV